MARVIALLDADCYEVQVWTKEDPNLQSVPVVVANSSKKIVAVNYPARDRQVSRNDNLKVACDNVKDLVTVPIPDRFKKPDQRRARTESYKMYDSIVKYREQHDKNIIIDYSSKDEFFIDITSLVDKRFAIRKEQPPQSTDFKVKTLIESTEQINGADLNESFWLHFAEENLRLVVGAIIMGEIILKIKEETGYQTSAGVAHSKLLAKVACGRNKPSAITVFTNKGFPRVWADTDIKKIPSLGGKRGTTLKTDFNVNTIKQLQEVSSDELVKTFGEKHGVCIYNLARGVDPDTKNIDVVEKSFKATIMVSRKIFGKRRLQNEKDLKSMLGDFAVELIERFDEELKRNKRRPSKMKIKLTRKKAATAQKTRVMPESGTFICSNNISSKEIVKKSLELLRENWAKSEMRPLSQITYAEVSTTQFANVEDENLELDE